MTTDPHWSVNCTAYCAAMLIGDATLGGCAITGRQVRGQSDEPQPEPGSPGLNITQIIDVARRHHVRIVDNTRQPWEDLKTAVSHGRRVMLQIDYASLPRDVQCQKGGDFGHAIVIANFNANGTVRASDPLCSRQKDYDPEVIRKAAVKFARDTGVSNGLRWCSTRQVPLTTVPWEDHPY